MLKLGKRLREGERGASIVEFALVAPVMCGFILGFLEFGHYAYVRSAAAGAIEGVARAAGVGGTTVDPRVAEVQFENTVKKVASTATFAWSKKSYYQFSGIGKAEKLVDDKNGNGAYDAGDCWEDSVPNSPPVYDTATGNAGIGGADDIVLYQVTVTWDPLINLAGLLPGVPNTRSTVVSTMVKRQPFAAQSTPAIRC